MAPSLETAEDALTPNAKERRDETGIAVAWTA
jgi:hypothetical protein